MRRGKDVHLINDLKSPKPSENKARNVSTRRERGIDFMTQLSNQVRNIQPAQQRHQASATRTSNSEDLLAFA